MTGGGGGPRALLGMVVVVVAGWGALTGVRAIPNEEQLSIDQIQSNYVYGNIKHAVNVYVKMFTNSPFLLCMDLAHSQEVVVDPKYLWVGPDGRNLEGQLHVNLTETGKLMVMSFKEFMSGAYTCTLSHKILETTTREERKVFETYKFMVYAYREADLAYQVFVRFTTEECDLAANDQFFGELTKILNNIISDLTCQIVESSYTCHSVKMPKQGLLHQLFVSFQVNPFAPGWEEACHEVPYDCEDLTNARVHEARGRIGEFFDKQTYALRHQFKTLPKIHYIENSFSVIHIDSCRPGFGKNDLTHKNCASCCVVCDPGTYSPNNDVTCQICPKPQVRTYGARSC